MKVSGLMLVKKQSGRLKNKNWRYYKGKPMFQWNLEKLLMVFDEVFVSSEDDTIMDKTESMGAYGITRPPELLEDTNIACYQHAIRFMNCDAFVAVQANSPEVSIRKIKWTKDLLELGHAEVKTCHEDKTDYGSIWGMTKERLKDYPDPYKACPSFWMIDKSVDIHTIEDLYRQYDESKAYKNSFRGGSQPYGQYQTRQNYDRGGESSWGGNSQVPII